MSQSTTATSQQMQLLDVDTQAVFRLPSLIAKRCIQSEEEKEAFVALFPEGKFKAEAALPHLLSKIEAMLEKCTDDELDSFTQAIGYLIVSDQAQASSNFSLVVKSLTASTSNSPQILRRRLRCLTILTNLTPNSQSKFEALNAILGYSINKPSALPMIAHFHSRIDEWVTAWVLGKLEKRTLYHNMSIILSASKDQSHNSIALSFLIKYFKTFEGEAWPQEVNNLAIDAVVSAIKAPVSSFSDRNSLLLCFNRKGAATSPPLSQLINLLKILSEGSVSDFEQFSKSVEGNRVLTEFSINSRDILDKLRLMAFCALGCEQNVITYKEIVSKLGLSSQDEVQDLVVDAVSQGLMEAYMDELNRAPSGELLPIVIIKQCAHRSFNKEQWVILQGKLRNLKTNISKVLEAINKK